MARVDYTGVPETAPQIEAPNDEQRISASPEAFGSQVGEAVSQGGQQLLDLSKFYGRVAADNATNNTLEQVTSILHGDPNRTVPGPDGKPVPDTGFYGLRGADAMSAWPKVSQQIDQVMRQNGSSLKTQEAQYQYDVDTRRYRAQWLREAGSYADGQQRVWATDTNNTSATLALNAFARTPAGEGAYDQARQDVGAAYLKNAQLAGENVDGAMLKAEQAVALTQVRSLIGTDPGAAKAALARHGDVLASLPNYDQIVRQVKAADIDARLNPAIDKAVGEAVTDSHLAIGESGQTMGVGDLQGAILGQESGNQDNIRDSANGAKGPGQIMPKTFAQYARPGENIANPADNRAVSGRIVQDYYTKYNGDPGRVATAYFSGPGNVAPAGSPTPWLHDTADSNGKTVSAYVANVQSRMTRYPTGTDALEARMPLYLEQAQKDAEGLFPDYPDAQERYVSGVERRLDRFVTQQRQQYTIDTHVVESALASDNPPASEDDLLARGPQVAAAWNRMQLENPTAAMGVERRFDANAKGKQTLYGSNFKDYLDRVAAPQTDPDRIGNPAQLWPFVGKGAESPLTNTGASALSDLMAARGTPQGEAYIGQVRSFMDLAHANLTFSNKAMGIYDEKGEQAFAKFAAQALPVLNNAYKQGQIAQALNPKSPDYVGNMAQGFMRKPDVVMKDRLNATMGMAGAQLPPFTRQSLDGALNRLDSDEQRRAALKDAVTRKRISMQDATAIGVQRGYIQGPAGPQERLVAPLPQPQTIPGYNGTPPHG